MTADQVKALVRSHAEGDEERFYAIATQVAARRLRSGHTKFALELRDLVDLAKARVMGFGAALRHLFAHLAGEALDGESELPHLSHAAASCLTPLEVPAARAAPRVRGGEPRGRARR